MKKLFILLLIVCSLLCACGEPGGCADTPGGQIAGSSDSWEVIRTPESTAFSVISYSRENRVLRVQFRESGAWYRYYDFEPAMWERFKEADSKGGYFNQHIKGKYEYKKEKG